MVFCKLTENAAALLPTKLLFWITKKSSVEDLRMLPFMMLLETIAAIEADEIK